MTQSNKKPGENSRAEHIRNYLKHNPLTPMHRFGGIPCSGSLRELRSYEAALDDWTARTIPKKTKS